MLNCPKQLTAVTLNATKMSIIYLYMISEDLLMLTCSSTYGLALLLERIVIFLSIGTRKVNVASRLLLDGAFAETYQLSNWSMMCIWQTVN